jgi:hypothetical protein
VNEIEDTERHRKALEERLRRLIRGIGEVPIGTAGQFPFGWRKAAKGRTVWRILEEVISQNLEKNAHDLGLHDFTPASSEVGVFDFAFRFEDSKPIYVNIKSAVRGRAPSKDDVSKAEKLIAFYEETEELTLFIATIEIAFHADPIRIELTNCYIVPTAWLPDIYVNPSNNGNLQSSKYKDLSSCIPRTRLEFVAILKEKIQEARGKRALKLK